MSRHFSTPLPNLNLKLKIVKTGKHFVTFNHSIVVSQIEQSSVVNMDL